MKNGIRVAAILVVLLLECAPWLVGSGESITRQDAAKLVVTTSVKTIWAKANQKMGMRVLQYGELLPEGTVIRSASALKGADVASVKCDNPCWLFFVDAQPGAHFAHPVKYIILDARTRRQRIVDADWWPQIDDQPLFNTLEKRNDSSAIVFDKARLGALRREKLKEIIGGPSGPKRTHDPCSCWGVIVCGYDDLPDTFDEDTDGMYAILIALGLPDDHIFFVSPHTTHPGVDRTTSIANVQWAISQVAASADETDKVLFFYSSHGGIDALICMNPSPVVGSISAADLDNWLDAITCGEMTIIVEACHSGSLIGRYADGTYTPSEDDLTGDGETNRCIFTSASTNTSSWPDVDGPDDPNPGDAGSETIWGYVEAFSVSSADLNGDGEISFGEGWQYAWDNDVTRIRGWNTPQMMSTGLTPANVYNFCYRVAGNGDLFIADGPGDVGHNSYDYNSTDIWVTQDLAETDHHDVVSGMDNYVHVAVHNRGTTPIVTPSLKVYWADVSTATVWPADFHQIGVTHSCPTLASGESHSYVWTWFVDPAIGLGHHFCLVAVADAPGDPATGGPPGVVYVAPYDNNIAQKNITIVLDAGHGQGSFDFVLQNNATRGEPMDLVIDWVGQPWGSVVVALPDSLSELVKRDTTKLENLRPVRLPSERRVGFEVIGAGRARIRGLALKPGQKHVVSVTMTTNRTRPGQRSEIRLRTEANQVITGALVARLQEVSPDDCSWVARLTVESFADLALRFRLDSARTLSKLFGRAINSGLCRSERGWPELLARALSIERATIGQLPRSASPGTRERLGPLLDELGQALERRDVHGALRSQGQISEVLREL